MKPIKELLIIRMSALGDVAMTIPIIYLLAEQNPSISIRVLTRERFKGYSFLVLQTFLLLVATLGSQMVY